MSGILRTGENLAGQLHGYDRVSSHHGLAVGSCGDGSDRRALPAEQLKCRTATIRWSPG